MGLRKKLLGLAVSLVAFNALLWGLPKIAPEVPERYEGIMAATPPPGTAAKTTAPPLPPGFPSMERPPPKIEVPDGQPQPIDTKFGLTYDIPADWRNFSGGYVTWTTGDESVTYGAIGDFGYKYCPESDGSTLAESGMTGRNGMDVYAAALDAARGAEIIFGDTTAPPPVVAFAEPTEVEVAGQRAVRYTVSVTGIHQRQLCDPTEAIFDVVAMTAYATAPVAVFMIELHQDVEGALDHSVADQVISTIRRTDSKDGVGNGT
ncbi:MULTISPECIES: hypothetical protein [unclassified Rhodococcus (in: high G+C Gram-positive bacteria)]|uniref:hypothetical protein n=1 Tax=unclassified Rhodococcus (in: high G+C Gram-positive bacteria) TaxID=192944 RepID=UPI0033933B15